MSPPGCPGSRSSASPTPRSRRRANGSAGRFGTPGSPIRRDGSPSTSPRRTCARRAPRSTWRWPSASCSGRSRSGRAGAGSACSASSRWAARSSPCPGVLPMVAAMARRGVRRVAVARSAAVEAGLVDGVEVLPVDTLTDVVELVRSARSRASPAASPRVGLDDDRDAARARSRLTPPGPSAGADPHPGSRRRPRPVRGAASPRDRARRRARPAPDRSAGVGQDHAREHRAGPPPAARRRGRAVGDDRGVGGRGGADDRPRPPAAVPEPASHDLVRGDGRRRAAAVARRDHAGGPRRAVPRRASRSSTATSSNRSASRWRRGAWRSPGPAARRRSRPGSS